METDIETREEAYRRHDAIVAYDINGNPWPGYYIPLEKLVSCERELADVLKLFESSKRARQSLSDACDHLQRELTDAREQRDKLAEASKSALDVFINQGWDDDLIAAQKLKDALAPIKEGNHE